MHVRRVFHVKQLDEVQVGQVFGLGDATLRHAFVPHGLTVAWVRGAVTLVVHTWPEHTLLTLDAYGLPVTQVEAACAELGWVAR